MRRRIAVRTGILVLVLILLGVCVTAAEIQDAIVPQLLVGTLAGYAGGAAGAFALAHVFAAGATGWDALARAILGAFVGLAGGTVVGSSLGVMTVGHFRGMEGSIGLCFLGAIAGTGTAFGVGISFRVPELVPYFAAPAAAVGATAGFNHGARVRP